MLATRAIGTGPRQTNMTTQTTQRETNTKHTAARPPRPTWLEALPDHPSASATIRAGMAVWALYPDKARPTHAAVRRGVTAELIEALEQLHYADLFALNEVVRILAKDHDGARWIVRHTNQRRADLMARIDRWGKGRAVSKIRTR